jgi:NAD+ diphosphatase
MKPILGYATNPLVRHTAERDPAVLEHTRDDPSAARVLIAGDVPILRAGTPATGLLSREDLARIGEPQEEAFLGTLQGRPVLATLAKAEAADLFREDPGYVVSDLRSVAVKGLVAEGELGILAMAKSLLDWHRRHRFCSACGAPSAPTQAGFRRDCTACGTQHFPRTDPVVIMLISDGERCLLGRQSRFLPGMYSCLAGFLEPGETVEDAVRRETFEEAGVRVGAVRYVASQPWPFPANLMIGCRAEALGEEIVVDRSELEDARWFGRDEVAAMLDGRHPDGLRGPVRMAIAYHLIRGWLDT